MDIGIKVISPEELVDQLKNKLHMMGMLEMVSFKEKKYIPSKKCLKLEDNTGIVMNEVLPRGTLH